MKSLQEYIDLFKQIFPEMPDDRIIAKATDKFNQISKMKEGDNVVRLEYYGGLLTENETQYIEELLKKGNLELNKFDKNGIPNASIQDFTLQMSLYLQDPIIQNLVLGVSGGAIWDALKLSAVFIWNTVKERHWNSKERRENHTINFGFKYSTKNGDKINVNLNGDLSPELLDKALDILPTLIRESNKVNHPMNSSFYYFDKDQNKWIDLDVLEELRKRHYKRKK
ncbi:hypothetical protein [Sphingobacterium siyangense]|uniref:hypothetical protein n=1 Tax=Sphingobacterium siyangense TaxID=459529 RepID=UPI0028A8DAEF|nr:hypothetical protein [Sphingobacterium siyangense]